MTKQEYIKQQQKEVQKMIDKKMQEIKESNSQYDMIIKIFTRGAK